MVGSWLLAAPAVRGEICQLRQLTRTTAGDAQYLATSLDGRRTVWEGDMNPLGLNPALNNTAFLYDARSGAILQLTPGGPEGNLIPDISDDGRWVVFQAREDLTGENPAGHTQIFLYDVEGRRLHQMSAADEGARRPGLDGDGSRIVFTSTGDLTGENADRNLEVFYLDRNAARIVQVSHTAAALCGFPVISPDGNRIAFECDDDITGGNPDHSDEVFVYSIPANTFTQVTASPVATCRSGGGRMSFDGSGTSLLLPSGCNLTGANADLGAEVFRADLTAATLTQIRGSSKSSYPGAISGDGASIVLSSEADYAGRNADGSLEIFQVHVAGGTEQLTNGTGPGGSYDPDLSGDGRVVVFSSTDNPTGENPERNGELFRRVCFPDPPSSIWLSSSALPGFQFQVRVRVGGTVVPSRQESACLAETVCISAAVPGRSELFLRVVGPKPNGYLWPNVIKFSTSQIEVWVRQVSSGEIQYYQLPQVSADAGELPGLFDRFGFLP